MKLLRELISLQHEHGWLSDETLRQLAERQRIPLFRLEELASFYTHFHREPPKKTIVHFCRDVCCQMAGSHTLNAQLRDSLKNQDDVEICEVSCLGRCDSAPAVVVNDQETSSSSPLNLESLLGLIESTHKKSPSEPQHWDCDPYANSVERFGTVKSLVKQRADIAGTCISELQSSGLKGMGGAGFPTGRKWELVAAEKATTKYAICNADESEPGTFKDRVILAELPHLVIEGMLLAALTIQAEQGIIFLRHEYEPERQALEWALAEARETGILGDNAAGSGKKFDIEIFVSPGDYILGEETALLEALEDKRGEPRNKPPYPGTYGLWGKPTLINNVESYTWATTIVNRGADWWNCEGVNGAQGRKFVCISGDVKEPGVFEIPLGTTVNELIELAGGLPDGKPLLAFLPGGASSNFLPANKVDTPLDFEPMKQAGSMLGTGAVIIICEGHNLFALATNLVQFFRNESCGKCVPCRLGSQHAVELLEGVLEKETSSSTLAVLPELGETLEQTSICGLGQIALNPILSILKHFPEIANETH